MIRKILYPSIGHLNPYFANTHTFVNDDVRFVFRMNDSSPGSPSGVPLMVHRQNEVIAM